MQGQGQNDGDDGAGGSDSENAAPHANKGKSIPHNSARSNETRGFLSLVLVCISIAVGVHVCEPIQFPLEWWNVTIGDHIRQTGQLPYNDVWAEVSKEGTWRASGWLLMCLISLVHDYFPIRGLLVLKMISLVLSVATISLVCSILSRNRIIGGIIGVSVSAVLLQNSPLDPVTLAFAALALFILLVYELPDRSDQSWIYWTIFLVSAIATNIHISVMLFPVIAICLLSSGVLPHLVDRTFVRFLALFSVLLGMLFSPYLGMHLVSALRGVFNLLVIDIVNRQGGSVFYFDFAMLTIVLLLLIFTWFAEKTSMQMGEVFLVCSSLLVSLLSGTFAGFALLICATVLSRQFGRVPLASLGRLGIGIQKLTCFLGAWPKIGTAWLFLVLAFIWASQLIKTPQVLAAFPVKEMEIVRKENLPFPLVHNLAISGYIAYSLRGDGSQDAIADMSALDKVVNRGDKGSPNHGLGKASRHLWISPATGLISPRAVVRERDLWRAYPSWQTYLAEAGAKTILLRTIDPLYQVLKLDERNWRFVYQGNTTPSWALFTIKE